MIRLLAATLTVAATSADDAVWLVPYVLSPHLPLHHRILHALIFIGTLQVMVLLCVLMAHTIGLFVTEEYILGAIGATLCWGIAIFMLVKKIIKSKKRREQMQAKVAQQEETHLLVAVASTDSDSAVPVDVDGSSYGSVPTTSHAAHEAENEALEGVSWSPWVVVSLTMVGALDEVSYFPSLILGKVFSPVDLCLGTFLAACLIVAVVGLFLSRCRPILEFLDRIPLYAVLFVFATILTIGAILDYFQEQ